MSQLTHLKRRIKSIKTTQKITQAMRLIAMSLYSKLEKKQNSLEYYKVILNDLFNELSQKSPEWKNSTFFPEDILDSNPLFIIISATKGFCGGLNNNLFRYLEHKLFVEEHQEPTFITIGKKATEFVRDKQLGPILESCLDLNSNNFPDIAKKISKNILEKKPEYSSVIVYSSIFKNFFAQKPEKTQVIPIIRDKEEKKEIDLDIQPIWEQESEEIVDFIANKYLDASLTNIFYQALISEYAARFVAMDGATTNAENYLETLTLQFNKMRQALITMEVAELSASL